jgi:hypothetical protein
MMAQRCRSRALAAAVCATRCIVCGLAASLQQQEQQQPLLSYSVTAQRTNFEQPVISTHLHMPISRNGSHTARSDYFFNFNPTSLQLPDGTWAIILRTVANQTNPATHNNPDFLTLSRVRQAGDVEGRGTVIVDPVNESSIILRPSTRGTLDDRGVQDPRVMRDPDTGIYWLTASSIGSSYVGTVISNSVDGLHWRKVSRCDTDHTHPFETRVDPISNLSCNYGRAAAILWRPRGEHYMMWGAGTLNLARSVNRSLTRWVTVKKAWLSGLPERGAWVNPGGPPVKLSCGNYLFVHVEAGIPRPPLRPAADPCPGRGPDDGGGHAWWGMGWAILNGSDPSEILQRGSELLFPATPWEKRVGASHSWEWRGCMIGDASGLMPLDGASERDSFLLWYGGGDSVSGAAVVKVRLKGDDDETSVVSDLLPGSYGCAASDANLLQWRQLVCSSLVSADTKWCGKFVKNGAATDWPSQATYLHELLSALTSPSTCLNTSFACGTVEWLNTMQTNSSSTVGNFMWTWQVFQRQYYDMPRKPGTRIESAGTLGRKCWAFSFLKATAGLDALVRVLQQHSLQMRAFIGNYSAAIPQTMQLCDRVRANCFLNTSYDPQKHNGTCPLSLDEFDAGFARENLKPQQGRTRIPNPWL